MRNRRPGGASINHNALYPQLLSQGAALTQTAANPFTWSRNWDESGGGPANEL